MASLSGVFLVSFIVALSGALIPGPLLTATIVESSRHGFRAGPLLVAGHAILESALVGALFLGLAPFLTDKLVIGVISLAGAAILLWLSFSMFRSLPTLAIGVRPQRQAPRSRLVTSGILISIANPYWSIWWATIGLAWILQARQWGAAGVVVFFIGHITADLGWYSLVSFSIGRGRAFFTDKIYRVVAGFCAVFLMVFALIFIGNGMKKLFL
jgi:threonine/homoserine/homoserine lactone efflux protein